jgi:molybdate transport system substrate-binding protein
MAAGRIIRGSEVELTSVPLAAAIHQGSVKPDISGVQACKQAVLKARLLVMPGSTSGLFVKDEVFPKLAISDRISFRIVTRGTDSTAMVASGEADLAIEPVSELVNQRGVELVGPLPDEIQLVQIFTAAIVSTSSRSEEAKRLIDYLALQHRFRNREVWHEADARR